MATITITRATNKHLKSGNEQGFSLIELLIVVAIILIIAAIAVPNLIRSKIAANESSATGSVRSIVTAQVAYSSTYGIGFAPSLTTLGSSSVSCAATSTSACLLDPLLASGIKSGYTLATSALGTNNVNFVVTAAPSTPNLTGNRVFCSDETMVLRFQLGGAAPADDLSCEALSPISQGL
jgi:type IV pilus assembly protein PilA